MTKIRDLVPYPEGALKWEWELAELFGKTVYTVIAADVSNSSTLYSDVVQSVDPREGFFGLTSCGLVTFSDRNIDRRNGYNNNFLFANYWHAWAFLQRLKQRRAA
jgi:hypothetical protein